MEYRWNKFTDITPDISFIHQPLLAVMQTQINLRWNQRFAKCGFRYNHLFSFECLMLQLLNVGSGTFAIGRSFLTNGATDYSLAIEALWQY